MTAADDLERGSDLFWKELQYIELPGSRNYHAGTGTEIIKCSERNRFLVS